MGFTRKALFLATGGLSGLAIKANSAKERTARAAEKQVRLQRQLLKANHGTSPVPQSPRTSDIASEIIALADLHKRGTLTDGEFAAARDRILGA